MLQCFCKNQTGVRQRRKSLVTDPRITGEECTFATTNRQLPFDAHPILKGARMIVPELALAVLSELLIGNSGRNLDASIRVRGGFKTSESGWAFLFTTAQNETWYFRSIASNGNDLSAIASAQPQPADTWSLNPRLSEQAKLWGNETLASIGHPDPGHRLCVIQCQRFGTVLSVLCTGFDLVATALQSWGNPPAPVVQDWKRQLDSHLQPAANLCTSETLVTENGTLIPLFKLVRMLETDSSDKRIDGKRPGQHSVPFLTVAPPWPEGDSSANPVDPPVPPSTALPLSHPIFTTNITAPTIVRSIPIATRKSSNRNWIAASVAGACMIAAAVCWFNSNGEPVASTVNPSVQPQQAANPSERTLDSSVENSGNSVTDLDDAEIVLTREPGLTITASETTSSDLTLEGLLAELSPNKATPIRLDSLNASSIIAEVLSPQGTDTPIMPPFPANGELGEPDEGTVLADVQATVSDDGVITLERPIEIKAAVSKETIAVGKFVVAKACRCDVTLKVTDELIIEPMEQVSIEGIGKAQWRIAIEDEEPELLVEVASKPGARWQIVASVGLRETRNSPPILIGPRQAQNVGNRLVDYRHWLKSSIETLRTARSNNRGRSDFDFTGEIKKLERQDKEAEKAIDRWKMVARLCHYFFDSNDVRLQLNAVA